MSLSTNTSGTQTLLGNTDPSSSAESGVGGDLTVEIPSLVVTTGSTKVATAPESPSSGVENGAGGGKTVYIAPVFASQATSTPLSPQIPDRGDGKSVTRGDSDAAQDVTDAPNVSPDHLATTGNLSKIPTFAPPPSAESGTGTGIDVDLRGSVTSGNIGEGKVKSGYAYEMNYGQALRWTVGMEKDTTAEWPVSVKMDASFYTDDPGRLSVEDLQARVNSQGDDCVPSIQIEGLETKPSGLVKLVLNVKWDCQPTKESELTVEPTPSSASGSSGSSGSSPSGLTVANPSLTTRPTSKPSGVSVTTSDTSTSIPSQSQGYSRGFSLPDRCAPSGTEVTLPLKFSMEATALGSAEMRLLFDPNLVRIDAIRDDAGHAEGAAAPVMEITESTVNNSNGYATLSLSGTVYDPEGVAAYVDATILGDSGETASIDLYGPSSHAYRPDGSEIDWSTWRETYQRTASGGYTSTREYSGGVNWGASDMEVRDGCYLSTTAIPFNSSGEVVFGAQTGGKVERYEAELVFPSLYFGEIAGITGEDFPDPEWSVEERPKTNEEGKPKTNEDGKPVGYDTVLTVSASHGSGGVEDPRFCRIEIDTKKPTLKWINGHTDDPVATQTEIGYDKLNQDGGTALFDSEGMLTLGCQQRGGVSVPGGYEREVPEVGVAYWPLVFPIRVLFPGINPDNVDPEEIELIPSSATNPRIASTVSDVVVGTVARPNTLFIDAVVAIPKADPQSYPVRWSLDARIGTKIVPVVGGGLALTDDVQMGDTGAAVFRVNPDQVGLGSGGMF